MAEIISQNVKSPNSNQTNRANLNYNIKKRDSNRNNFNMCVNNNHESSSNRNNSNFNIESNDISKNNINLNLKNTNTSTLMNMGEDQSLNFTNIQKNFSKKNSFHFDKGNFINMKKRNLFDEYEIVGKLGEGAFGCVYKLFQKKTGFIRAVKVIKKQNIDNEYLFNEIIVLKSIDHPNIIKTFECYFDSNHYYMIQEYCSGGDLYDYIKKQKFFNEKKAACIMYQLLSALNHLHSKKIVHRDLKPENIVFINLDSNKHNSINCKKESITPVKNEVIKNIGTNKNEVDLKDKNESKNMNNINNNEQEKNEIFIKVIDFGTSIFINNQPLTQELGTIYYIAPEVFKNNYNEKCDIWSCGIILYTMLCGHPPFRGKKEEDIKNKILKGEGNFNSLFTGNEWKQVSKDAIAFVTQLLEYNINKRLSSRQALDNNWLNNLIKANEKLINVLDKNIIQNLIKFHSSVVLQKASLAFIAIQTGESEEISRIKREFDKIDKNRDGVITKMELIECKSLI